MRSSVFALPAGYKLDAPITANAHNLVPALVPEPENLLNAANSPLLVKTRNTAKSGARQKKFSLQNGTLNYGVVSKGVHLRSVPVP
jgi:hypothetical protein